MTASVPLGESVDVMHDDPLREQRPPPLISVSIVDASDAAVAAVEPLAECAPPDALLGFTTEATCSQQPFTAGEDAMRLGLTSPVPYVEASSFTAVPKMDAPEDGAYQTSTPPSPAPSSSASEYVSTTDSDDDGVLRAYAEEPPVGSSSQAPASPCKRHGTKPLVGWLRAKVSQNKVRFREGNFDLDLTYITPRIIAMGYPAHGTEYYIRNPIDHVEAFFFTRHDKHFRIYNLCAERHYDRADRFHGRFKSFPFDDHNVPTLALMCDFVDDAVAYLNEDALNVVAVHCKAGKGRTGLMTTCLLLAFYPDKFNTAQEAAHFFDQKRTNDGRALTIPSQQRYASYYEIMLKKCGGRPPPETRSLALGQIRVQAPALRNVSFTSDFYFTVSTHNRILLDSRLAFPNGPVVDKKVGIVYVFQDPMPTLTGDIKLTFYRRKPFVLSGKESHAFYTWFNTNFCDDHFVLHREALDKVDKSAAGKEITLEVSLQPLPYMIDFTV